MALLQHFSAKGCWSSESSCGSGSSSACNIKPAQRQGTTVAMTAFRTAYLAQQGFELLHLLFQHDFSTRQRSVGVTGMLGR